MKNNPVPHIGWKSMATLMCNKRRIFTRHTLNLCNLSMSNAISFIQELDPLSMCQPCSNTNQKLWTDVPVSVSTALQNGFGTEWYFKSGQLQTLCLRCSHGVLIKDLDFGPSLERYCLLYFSEMLLKCMFPFL